MATLTLGSPLLWWTLLLGVLSLVLAAVEHGWGHLSHARLAEGAEGPTARNRLQRILDAEERVADGLIVLRVGAQIALVMVLVMVFHQALAPGAPGPDAGNPMPAAVLGAAATAFVWITLFCRVLPGEMSARRLEGFVRTTIPLIHTLSFVLAPPVEAFRRLARRMTGHDEQAETELYADEIRSTLEEGTREGHLAGDQAEMMEGVLSLGDTEVHELMTPRTDMDVIDIGATVAEAREIVRSTGRSRYPLVEGTVDKVEGVLHAKDLLGHEDSETVQALARKPWFVPESKYCAEMLAEFRRDRAHLALVLDEYGGTAGLVTIEDVIEEIVGEIDDEFDETEAEPELVIVDPHHAVAQGTMHVDELNKKLSVSIPESDDWSTVGGFLFHTLGRLPEAGEELRHGNLLFRIEQVEDRRIGRVAIEIQEVAA